MNLSNQDLDAIRGIMREETTALEEDFKEIYRMIARMQEALITYGIANGRA